ncbi:unnamed protein product, partial [Amoebophrya sp. A25]
ENQEQGQQGRGKTFAGAGSRDDSMLGLLREQNALREKTERERAKAASVQCPVIKAYGFVEDSSGTSVTVNCPSFIDALALPKADNDESHAQAEYASLQHLKACELLFHSDKQSGENRQLVCQEDGEKLETRVREMATKMLHDYDRGELAACLNREDAREICDKIQLKGLRLMLSDNRISKYRGPPASASAGTTGQAPPPQAPPPQPPQEGPPGWIEEFLPSWGFDFHLGLTRCIEKVQEGLKKRSTNTRKETEVAAARRRQTMAKKVG